MFDRRITTAGATPLSLEEQLAPVRSMAAMLQHFAVAGRENAATQHGISAGGPESFATRYAAANSITRRRFDAILREAETVSSTGFRLIMGRGGRPDPATIAAARFLGNSIAATLRKLDRLLPNPAI